VVNFCDLVASKDCFYLNNNLILFISTAKKYASKEKVLVQKTYLDSKDGKTKIHELNVSAEFCV